MLPGMDDILHNLIFWRSFKIVKMNISGNNRSFYELRPGSDNGNDIHWHKVLFMVFLRTSVMNS